MLMCIHVLNPVLAGWGVTRALLLMGCALLVVVVYRAGGEICHCGHASLAQSMRQWFQRLRHRQEAYSYNYNEVQMMEVATLAPVNEISQENV